MSGLQASHSMTSSPLSQIATTESSFQDLGALSNGISSILTSQPAQSILTDTTFPPGPQEPYFDPEEPRSLIFPDFSFISPEGKIDHLAPEHSTALSDYLQVTYNAVIIDPHLPYLCIWTDKPSEIPSPASRPVKIAGLVARWFAMKRDHPPLDLELGEQGSNPSLLVLHRDIASDLAIYALPSVPTLRSIRSIYFPNAVAVGYINDRILVELPETSVERYAAKLKELPRGFEGEKMPGLYFFNGLLEYEVFRFVDQAGWYLRSFM